MNGEDKAQVVKLLQDLRVSSPSLSSVVQLLQHFQAHGFLSGVHLCLKRLTQLYSLETAKASFLTRVAKEIPDLAVDVAIMLVTEKTEEVRTEISTLLGLVYPCAVQGLREVVLVERVLERFPELDNAFFLPSLFSTPTNDLIHCKFLDYQYRLAKARGLLPPVTPEALVTRFAAPSPSYRAQILLDLQALQQVEDLKPLISQLLSAPEVVRNILQCVSYNDDYLISSCSLLISLGRNLLLPELDPYSVFYHFLCLLEWSMESFFDMLLEDVELLELTLCFAKEARTSERKWSRYVYVMKVYEARRRDVNEFLTDLCAQLTHRHELLHFNTTVVVERLQTLLD